MTKAEIFAVYGAPLILVIGGALMAWRNHVVMRKARNRDRDAANTVAEALLRRKATEAARVAEPGIY